MAIQIVRNSDGNCIEFRGSTNPVYYNACLSAEVDAEFTNTLNVINDVATAASAQTIYEFYNIDYTEFRDASNNPFASAQRCTVSCKAWTSSPKSNVIVCKNMWEFPFY